MSSLVSLFRSSPFLAISGGLYLLAALSLVFHSSSSSRPAFTPSPSSPSHPHHPDVDFETPSDVRTGISSLWPTSQGGKGDVKSKGNLQWKDHNKEALRALLGCLATETCADKQKQVVILEANEFSKSVYAGYTSGEGIWARSITEVLQSLGYTYLYAKDMNHVGTFHLMLPDLIKAVIAKDSHARDCAADKECVRTKDNPQGIRLQSIFSFAFFGNVFNPLGREWSITPEGNNRPGTTETYIGYSIEHDCMAMEVPKYEDRKRQVWILAKHHRYFTSNNFPYSADIFEKASKELNIEFIGAWNDANSQDLESDVPGVTRLGGRKQLPQEEFDKYLTGSLATVGLMDPWISPTPYYSICYGVPFINPTRPGWEQHPYASDIPEEHGILSVHSHNDTDFIRQLRRAIEPHERYTAPWMTHAAMEERVEKWLQTDWTARAKEVDDEVWRKRDGKDYRHVLL